MQCVIKADDLVLGSFRFEWEQFFELIAEHDAVASTGVIGKPSETALARDPSAANWLLPWVANPRFEFWNHGYAHTHAEFFAPLEQQIESIRRTQGLMQEGLGIATTIFGPPFNRYSPTLFKACAATGVEILYHGETDLAAFCVPARSFATCEIKDAGNDPDGASFMRTFERIKARGAPYFVLQVHPWRWSTGVQGGFAQFGRILRNLANQGVEFVSAAELRKRHQRPAPAGKELARRIADQALTRLEAAGQANPRLRHDFFATRYARGLEAWSAKVEALGLTEQTFGRTLSALDIGCGVGQWATAFALRNPASTVVAVDPGADFLDVLTHAIADTPLQSRIAVVESRAEDYVHRSEPVDVVINASVQMFAEHEQLVRAVSGASRIGSRHYLSYHTDRHYVRKILDAFELQGDRRAAQRWARTHASINLGNVGLGSPWVREWCLPKDRLLDHYRAAGFDIVDTPSVWDAEDRHYDGAETFVEFIFEKRSEFDTGVRDFVGAQASLAQAAVRLVQCELPRTALDLIEAAGGPARRADLKTPFLLASTKGRELIPVFEMDLEDSALDPFAIALFYFEVGHTKRAIEILATLESPASIFLQCMGLRQMRRIADACELALARCTLQPSEPLLWCALFFTSSIHPDPAAFGAAVDLWRQVHRQAVGR